MGTIKEDLGRGAERIEETHISWVFIGSGEVCKVKKPVSLGFLDFATIEDRHAACLAEVHLNRRLAPDVYLGVVPVTRDASGNHRLGGDGEAVDWAVHMRRLPDADRADSRLRDGRLESEQLDALAAMLTGFHARARRGDAVDRHATIDALRGAVRENIKTTRETITEYVSVEQAREIIEWQNQFLDTHQARFASRIADGRVCEGHGDLRLEHVYIGDDGAIRVIDCVEFAERYRCADTCSDVAFLSMDLTWHGRADLAERFLAAYAREANDFDLYPLVDFYESYRAYVRAKVASILAADPSVDAEIHGRARQEARRYYLLALASERRPLAAAHVIAVGGIIGAGKSTVAEGMGAQLGVPVVATDRTRKFLLGRAATERLAGPAWQDAYAPATTQRVYAEVLRRAREVLSTGRSVIIDASFRSRDARAAAGALAAAFHVPFVFVECRAPADVCKARLVERAEHASVSDARIDLFDEFVARWEPVDDLPKEHHIVVDTSGEHEATIRRALLAVGG